MIFPKIYILNSANPLLFGPVSVHAATLLQSPYGDLAAVLELGP